MREDNTFMARYPVCDLKTGENKGELDVTLTETLLNEMFFLRYEDPDAVRKEWEELVTNCYCRGPLNECLGTKECDPCSAMVCPVLEKYKIKQTDSLVKGMAPDAPVVTNEQGGKQSDSPYAFHMIPVSSVLAAAEVCAYGAKKYGETIGNRNYTKIPTEEHINHAIAHMYAYLAGDKTDDHLGHAIVRAMFAYDTAQRGEAV